MFINRCVDYMLFILKRYFSLIRSFLCIVRLPVTIGNEGIYLFVRFDKCYKSVMCGHIIKVAFST